MKKFSLFIIILFCLCRISIFAQQKNNFFKFQKEEMRGKIFYNYKEILTYDIPKIDPTDKNKRKVELISSKMLSKTTLDSIESTIFSCEEIKNLNSKYRCFTSYFISTTNGKIIKIDFIFTPRDSTNSTEPKIDLDKLADYALKIKEKIRFKLLFSNTIYNHGYIIQSSLVFTSYK